MGIIVYENTAQESKRDQYAIDINEIGQESKIVLICSCSKSLKGEYKVFQKLWMNVFSSFHFWSLSTIFGRSGHKRETFVYGIPAFSNNY